MRSLATKFLIISSLGVGLQSCKSYEPIADAKKEMVVKEIANPYFANPALDYVYKAQIDVYGNALSGLLVVKKTAEDTHRVVMTTDFGNKLMDFTITAEEVVVNYVVEDLNRKMILNILTNDLRLLVKEKHQTLAEYQKGNETVSQVKQQSRSNYFFFDIQENKLLKLVQSSKRKAKFSIVFDAKNTNFAEQITIEHYNFDIKIGLKQIIKE